MTLRKLYTTIAACAILSGCNDTKQLQIVQFEETAFLPGETYIASPSDSLMTIRLAVNETYCTKTACSCISDLATREYEEVQDILKSKYNIDLQLIYFSEEYDMKDSLLTQKFDGAICKPWLAFMLTPGSDFRFKRVADLLDPSGNQWLTGIFIVKKDSPIKSLDEIGGKILVAGQPDSYEKYHDPLRILSVKEIEPSQTINKAGCTECINCLLDDEADVAIISDYALSASCAVDLAKPEDFTIIGKTGQIPLCSVILDLSKVSEADALRLQRALIGISGDNAPVGLSGKGFVLPAKWAPVPVKIDKQK